MAKNTVGLVAAAILTFYTPIRAQILPKCEHRYENRRLSRSALGWSMRRAFHNSLRSNVLAVSTDVPLCLCGFVTSRPFEVHAVTQRLVHTPIHTPAPYARFHPHTASGRRQLPHCNRARPLDRDDGLDDLGG